MKIGINLFHLGNSQINFLSINYANILCKQTEHEVVLFYRALQSPCVSPLCSIMNISEIYKFDGIMISTDIEGAIIAKKSSPLSKQIFYVWDLEWMRYKKNFLYNMEAYRNMDSKLIARSESHAEAIQNYCNRGVDGIVKDFNVIEMINNGICD